MFGPPGHLYVYFSYGACTGAPTWSAVPRATARACCCGRPSLSEGIDLMRAARGRETLRELCSGPGRLAQAFGIDRSLDGSDVTGSGVLTVLDDGSPPPVVIACPRIGITRDCGCAACGSWSLAVGMCPGRRRQPLQPTDPPCPPGRTTSC